MAVKIDVASQVEKAVRAQTRRIAAETLRAAADEVYGDERAASPYPHPLDIASWLRWRADQIETATEEDA